MPLQIVRNDITKMRVDAIVNTTNEEMVGYSGVDLAVHTVAGKGLDEECRALAPLGLGEAKISGAYNLPCRYVIHTSGPIWHGGLLGESIILRSCYIEALKLAVKYNCRTVAFPLISSGTYGYPKDQVLKFAVQTITDFLNDNELTVYLCVFDKESYTFSQSLYDNIKSFIDDEYALEYDEYCAEKLEAEASFFPLSERLSDAIEAPIAVKETYGGAERLSLYEYMSQMDKSFQEMLFDFIDKSGMSDVECYKKANVDKRTFSKIKSNKGYKPSKQTVIAFAISLQLDIDETQALLATVGFTLSRSNVFDKIIRYFIYNKNYNIFEINEALFEFDQVLLGTF
ncbi:MAG: macro domain-containing protein [Clostridia bacterium]|nr:macro domain-containing protein [Clostridia bacterium]